MTRTNTKKSAWWERILASAWLSFWFVFVYNGCNYISSLRSDVGTCAFDWELDLFTFIPILIIPYWSIDILYGLAPLFLSNRFHLKQHVKRISFGILVAGVFFLLFPLELAFHRPAVEGWLAPYFSALENFNNFYNCAPSLHIVLLTNLWPVYMRLSKSWLKPVVIVWFILIEASTLFCWQHHIMDIVTGQLLGLFCLWLFPDETFALVKTDTKQGINSSPKVAYYYVLGYLLLLCLSLLVWPWGMLVLWPTTSLFIVSWAYLGLGPVFSRKHQGRQLLASRWLLNPYRWVAGLTAKYFTRGEQPYFELEPSLFFGRRLSDAEAKELSCESVLDLTCEYDECDEFLARNYKNVPILDMTCPTQEQLKTCLDFLQENPSCYVHCSLGRGRAGLVACGYLIRKGLGVEEAIERVRALRPKLHLSPGVTKLLSTLAD